MGRLVIISSLLLYWCFSPLSAGDGQQSKPETVRVESVIVRRNLVAEQNHAVLQRRNPNNQVPATRVRIAADGTLQGTGNSLDELIREAYGYVRRHSDDVVVADWMKTERYNVTITSNRSTWGAERPWNDLPLEAAAVLKTVLSEQFKVRVRTESRERRVYGLVLARRDRKTRVGLVPASGRCGDPDQRADGNPQCRVVVGNTLRAPDVTMPEFATILSGYVKLENRLVVDRTGLPGRYDVTMTEFFPWLHPPPRGGLDSRDIDRESKKLILLPSALKGMLGLKLDSMKARVDVLVVDHAERPVVR